MSESLALCEETEKSQILDILNDAILHTTALYDYRPRTIESMDGWFEARRKGAFPIVGVFDGRRRLLGFGSYGTFRNWPAYKYSIEHSIYVRRESRGKGIGGRILDELIRNAESQGFHTMIAGIDSENAVSIKLHEKAGFARAGVIRHAGFKFGRWLDLVFMQRILSTPEVPTEE